MSGVLLEWFALVGLLAPLVGVIRKTNGYEVKSEKTGRSFGKYRSRAGAAKRLRQIEYFKHRKAQRRTSR